jgi:hypothetical protein
VKAKNRVGQFELDVRSDPMIGTRVSIFLANYSMIDERITVGWEAASLGELKALIELLKADLDVILEKSAQYFE